MTRNLERIGEDSPARRRGAQPGNRNALRHGRRSAAAIVTGKLSTARVKALAHAAKALGMLCEVRRHRVALLRADQIEMLRRFDGELLDLVPDQYRSVCRAAEPG